MATYSMRKTISVMQITHHTTLLNALIEKYGLKSYLEIGIFNPNSNFDKIKCENKIGVDPDILDNESIYSGGSDEFFAILPDLQTFDLIFIDGLHHADQVKRDFENSLRCLSDNGFIVIHDVLPTDERTTHIPRNSKVWHGDVYKFAMKVYKYGFEYRTFNIDSGCMVVQKKPIEWDGVEYRDLPNYAEPSWQGFNEHKQRLLRITDEVTI